MSTASHSLSSSEVQVHVAKITNFLNKHTANGPVKVGKLTSSLAYKAVRALVPSFKTGALVKSSGFKISEDGQFVVKADSKEKAVKKVPAKAVKAAPVALTATTAKASTAPSISEAAWLDSMISAASANVQSATKSFKDLTVKNVHATGVDALVESARIGLPPLKKLLVLSENREPLHDDDATFLKLLPEPVRLQLKKHPRSAEIIEVTMDIGRPICAYFDATKEPLDFDHIVTEDDLEEAQSHLSKYSIDNRSGIEGSLHRISAIRNIHDQVIGLTIRVARIVPACLDLLQDLIHTGNSVLILGPPGSGKTTILREWARTAAEDHYRRTVIVDTSNEIAGSGDLPHVCVGRARRMMVKNRAKQFEVLVEAVQNHSPQLIVIDEIGQKSEVKAVYFT